MANISGTPGPDDLLGTPADDNIHGLAGDDTLRGLNGDDNLYGGADDDKLIGGNGFNRYWGGTGSDTFTMSVRPLDHSSEDVIKDFTFNVDHVNVAAWGISDFGQIDDLLEINVNLDATLNAFFNGHDHILTFGGDIFPDDLDASDFVYSTAGAKTQTGTNNDDVLFGSAFDDTLSGAGGDDDLLGGGGDDILIGGNGWDFFDGGAGHDRVSYAGTSQDLLIDLAAGFTTGPGPQEFLRSIEDAFGGGGDDQIFGSPDANTLNGRGGDDLLAGRRGNDVLGGGPGADSFLFDTSLNATTNVDRIIGFTPGTDEFRLDIFVFSDLDLGTLRAAQYREGNFTSAQDSSDRIIYNDTTGAVYYDRDGLGGAAAVKFAVIDPGLMTSLSHSDFFIVL